MTAIAKKRCAMCGGAPFGISLGATHEAWGDLDLGAPEEAWACAIDRFREEARINRQCAEQSRKLAEDAAKQAEQHAQRAEDFANLASAIERAPITFAASVTLTEGGDAKQAPGESLSGAVAESETHK